MRLWHEEKLFFEPGDLGFPVFAIPPGRVGVAICYDIWFPETMRLLAVQGADIICVPTNWVPMPVQPLDERPVAVYLCMAAAHTNAVYVAAADRIGTERGQRFLGHSVLVGPAGWPLAGPAGANEEVTINAECNLAEARRMKTFNELNTLTRDRRTDFYDRTLGSGVTPHGLW